MPLQPNNGYIIGTYRGIPVTTETMAIDKRTGKNCKLICIREALDEPTIFELADIHMNKVEAYFEDLIFLEMRIV